jgi:hypothetical protein
MSQPSEPAWNFEGEPPFEEMSEVGINLCAYFDAMSDAQLRTFDPTFSDAELMAWDGNFTSDGDLLLPCCESEDVDPAMYRRFIAECIRYRDRVRIALSAPARASA